MKKAVAIEWKAFIAGDIIRKDKKRTVDVIAKTAGTVHLAFMPMAVFAATDTEAASSDTWVHLLTTAMSIADWLCVGIIIYAGVTWMFGNRTKGIDLVLSGASGYIIIRHAVDIRNWLRTL